MAMEADQFFADLPTPQKEISMQLRSLIRSNFPAIDENMKWGVPTYGQGKVYIASLEDHVNLGFSLAELSDEQKKQLAGTGKTMRHLKLYKTADIDEKLVLKLLNTVFQAQLSR